MAAPNAWNVLLGAPTFSDPATLTASDERTGFPVTNLQLQDPDDRYEVVPSGGDRIAIHIDAGSAKSFNAIGLGYTNLSSVASWRVRWAYTLADVTAAPFFDSAPLGPCLRLYTSTSTARTNPGTDFSSLVDFTLECWFKVEGDLTNVGIIRRGTSSDDPTIWINGARKLVFGDPTDVTEQVTGTTTIVEGQWYHVAGAYSSSGTESAIIVDGVEEAVNSSMPGSWSTASQMRVGVAQTERMNGLLQSPRIWSKRRTASEVAADKDTLLVGTETNLEAAFQQDDGTGTTWTDVVNNLSLDMAITDCDWAYPERAWSVADYPTFMERHCLHTELPLGASARYLRIDVADPRNADGVLRFGRLNIGWWYQLQRNALVGTDLIGWLDTGSHDRAVNGAAVVVAGQRKRFADLKFGTDQASDVSLLNELYAARGGSYDVAFVQDPTETDSYTHQGFFMGLMQRRSRIRVAGYSYWTSQWTVEEL